MAADLGTATLVGMGLLAASSWAAVLWRKTGLWGVTLATLFASICLGYFFWHVEKPLPLSFDRLLWICLVLALVTTIVREPSTFRPARIDLLLMMFVAYLLASGLVVFFQSGATNSLSRWLFFYAVPATFYLAGRFGGSTSTYRVTLIFFSLLGLYLSVTGLAEVLGLKSLVFPPYVMRTSITDEFFGRARGPLLNPVGNGLLIVVGWSAWTLLPTCRIRLHLLLILFGHALFLTGVVCTLTRSVWLSALASGLVITLWFTPPRYRLPLLGVSLLLGCVTVAVGAGMFREIKRDRYLSPTEAARSIELRPLLATVAWRMICDRPLFGFGLAQYDKAKLPYVDEPTSPLPLRRTKPYTQHNVFLSLLVETGVAGLGLFLCVLAAAVQIIWRQWSHTRQVISPLAAVGLVAYSLNGLFHDVSIIVGMNTILFLLIGMLAKSAETSYQNLAQPSHSP